MTELTITLAGDSDDGSRQGTALFNTDAYRVGTRSVAANNPRDAWVRFVLPVSLAGATITDARLILKIYDFTGTLLSTIFAEDAASPSAPTTVSDYTGRVVTTASVDLDIPSPSYELDVTSGNLSAIIQELVDSYGEQLSVVQILHKDRRGTQTNNTTQFYDYTQSTAKAAQLQITYTLASAGYTGSGSVSLPALTASGTGTYSAPAVYAGSGAVSLLALTASGSGTYSAPAVYTGSGAVSLPALTTSGTGTYSVVATYTGSGAVSLPALTVVGVGAYSAVAVAQSAYRFYADDGVESASTALTSENAGLSVHAGARARLRVQLDATGDPGSSAFRLDYRRGTPLYAAPAQLDWSAPTLVLSPGATEGVDWDAFLWGGAPCCVVKHSGTYYLYYVGSISYDEVGATVEHRAIGVATSSDGVTFTKHAGNPIITYTTTSGVESEEGASNAVVAIDGQGGWHMWYGASRYIGPNEVDVDIRYRQSSDGLSWTGDTLIYTIAGNEYIPNHSMFDGSNWNLYFVGPLTGGKGSLRRLYGATPAAVANAGLVLSGSYAGASALNKIGETSYLLHLMPTFGTLEARIIDSAAPGSVGAIVSSYTFTDYARYAILLDGNLWRMYQIDIGGGSHQGSAILRTAQADVDSSEWSDWSPVPVGGG
jgi:hypothetical protein